MLIKQVHCVLRNFSNDAICIVVQLAALFLLSQDIIKLSVYRSENGFEVKDQVSMFTCMC